MTAAVLAPGYGGTADQPILRALGDRLALAGIGAHRVTFSTSGRRPSRDYLTEIADLRSARDLALAEHGHPVVLAGRSFGGRICAFLALEETPAALVLLGHPIAPPGRPRPRDEEALASIACPILIVQGDRDELGPLPVLERIAAVNPRITLSVVPRAGHSFGALEPDVVERAASWIVATLGPS